MATVHLPRRPVRSVRLALAWVVALFVLLGGPRLDAHGQPFFVVQYWVVSATPTAAGTEFVFRARLLNLGPAIPGLDARLTGSSAAATVLDDTLSFGPVGRFGAAWSADTASIRRHGRWIDIIKDFRWTFDLATANRPPVASAGPDQSARLLDRVVLDGSASSDPDGDALSYGWSLVSRPTGSAATLTEAGAVRPEFVVDVPGRYVLGLIVHDGTVESAPDFVEVSTANTRPTANAGDDRHVAVGETAVLDGSGSTDVDGHPLTYRWSLLAVPAGSGAALTDASAVAPSFTADLPGEYLAQLVVNDGLVDSEPDTVLVSTSNTRPVAAAGPDRTVSVGQDAIIDGSGSSDAEGDPLTFRWTLVSVPPGSAAAIQDPLVAVSAFTADRPGDYVLQLVVNDGALDSEPDALVISTTNSPPIADAGPDQSGIAVNTTVALDGSASSDPDGQPLQYTWSLISRPPASAAVLRDADTAFPSFVADAPGAYIAQLIVHDGVQASAPDVVVMTVDERPAVTIVVSDAGASEAGPDAGAFEIARTGPTLLPLVVEFAVSGAAREGVDYQSLGGRITIPAGAASALLPIVPIDDDLVEGAENVVVTLTAGADYVVVVPGIAGLQIADDDSGGGHHRGPRSRCGRGRARPRRVAVAPHW
jgi:hypothetical protein